MPFQSFASQMQELRLAAPTQAVPENFEMKKENGADEKVKIVEKNSMITKYSAEKWSPSMRAPQLKRNNFASKVQIDMSLIESLMRDKKNGTSSSTSKLVITRVQPRPVQLRQRVVLTMPLVIRK